MATVAKFVQPIPFFLVYLVPLDVDVVPFIFHQFLFYHFCVFHFFLAFWPFPWQQQPFWKNQPLKPQLHMIYDIPTRFHKV